MLAFGDQITSALNTISENVLPQLVVGIEDFISWITENSGPIISTFETIGGFSDEDG